MMGPNNICEINNVDAKIVRLFRRFQHASKTASLATLAAHPTCSDRFVTGTLNAAKRGA